MYFGLVILFIGIMENETQKRSLTKWILLSFYNISAAS